jgi:hypothetical protein
MTSLNLYQRPAEGVNHRVNLVGLHENWRRKKRAIGGFHTGKFAIRNRGMPELTDFYNSWIGMTIIERTYGIISYEGIVWQLDLIKNGVNYRRTLNPKYWHNRVKVLYTDSNGDRQVVGWSENTDSSGIHGEMEYIYTLGETSANLATSYRDSKLARNAWPRSRNVGGVEVGKTKPSLRRDGLYVTTAGFSATLNWQVYESTSSAATSTMLNTLIGTSEFVTAGRIETNSDTADVSGDPIPQRIGDMINEIVGGGDTSGNLWKGGVYANQEYIYEQLPTTVDYVLQRGMLLNKANIPVELPLVNPGFYVRDANAPRGGQPPGTSNIWDDPQVTYCDEVEFIYPDKLALKFPGEDQTVIVATPERIDRAQKRGRYGDRRDHFPGSEKIPYGGSP